MNRTLDLCAGGAAGWSLGCHRAGFNTVAACEVVDWRRDMLARNFPEARLYDDMRELTGPRIKADLGYLPDIIVGSPPCKEYSSVNSKGRGLDGDDLFMHAVRLVDEVRPRWFGAENSAFIKTRGYDRIADALGEIGYTCWPCVVGAENAGARHGRPRAFIIATDLSRSQGRATRFARPHGHVGATADLDAGGLFGRYRENLGPAGAECLGRHLREYDGVPAGVAEACREAYGDAVMPALTHAVALAMLEADAALAGLA